MDSARTDPDHPNLRFRNPRAQAIARLELISINLVGTALDVDGCEFSAIVWANFGKNIVFENGIAA